MAYDVYVIQDNQRQRCGSFETYEAAHYEAYGIWQQTKDRTEVLRGDVMIWNPKDGFHEQ